MSDLLKFLEEKGDGEPEDLVEGLTMHDAISVISFITGNAQNKPKEVMTRMLSVISAANKVIQKGAVIRPYDECSREYNEEEAIYDTVAPDEYDETHHQHSEQEQHTYAIHPQPHQSSLHRYVTDQLHQTSKSQDMSTISSAHSTATSKYGSSERAGSAAGVNNGCDNCRLSNYVNIDYFLKRDSTSKHGSDDNETTMSQSLCTDTKRDSNLNGPGGRTIGHACLSKTSTLDSCNETYDEVFEPHSYTGKIDLILNLLTTVAALTYLVFQIIYGSYTVRSTRLPGRQAVVENGWIQHQQGMA